MTRAELTERIQDWAEVREEETFDRNIEQFVRNAEQAVTHAIHPPAFVKSNSEDLVITTDPGLDRFLKLPDDFISMEGFSLIEGDRVVPLEKKSVDALRQYYPNWNVRRTPRYWAWDVGENLELAPTPDLPYRVNVRYFSKNPSIFDDPTTETWISRNAPNLLLHGALKEAAIFIKSQEMFLREQAAWGEALSQYLSLTKGRTPKDTLEKPDMVFDV